MTPTARFVIVCSLLLLPGLERPRAQPTARPVHWEGTLRAVVTEDFSRQENPFADGVWTAAFEVRVKWLEHTRIDVTDPSGRTVGQLVLLREAGSTWSAEAGGTARTRSRPETLALTGAATGTGVLQAGWLYQSLAEDDPLRDVLPNGTYALWTFAELPVVHVFTGTDGRVIRQPSPAEVPNQFMQNAIGTRLPVFWWSAAVPPPETLSTDSLRRLMANSLADYAYADQERRTLVNGRMQGGFEARGRASEAGVTRSVRWDLRRRLSISGALQPVDPSWRPRLAGTVTVKAALDPGQDVRGRFRFTLFDVSREKGYALNAGGSGTGLDLRFASEQPQPTTPPEETADGYVIETSGAGEAAAVTVAAFDYGAWGRLKAEVNVDGEWYALPASGGAPAITIPLDDNGNRIWDAWERNSGVWGQPASADGDAEPAGENDGDGLSNYEEYRGFVVGMDWVTTSPAHKELFIHDVYGRGVGAFSDTGVQVYTIAETQYDRNRVVNFNRGHASAGPQKGVLITDTCDLNDTTGGIVVNGPGTPNEIEHVCINRAMLKDAPTEEEAYVLGHELGHAVSVQHHGDWDEGRCNGGEPGLIAPWAGAWSGDRGCVMAYSSAAYYRAWDGRCYPWTFGRTFGHQYCETKAGTGFNAGERRMEDGHPMPVSGAAAHGNCRHQIRIR